MEARQRESGGRKDRRGITFGAVYLRGAPALRRLHPGGSLRGEPSGAGARTVVRARWAGASKGQLLLLPAVF